ncbi:efflux RND transporter periplasmic adaptor subunit [Paenibacillus sp. GSMTC-2017]|uniref:efflux RND transporter periplasmic adaptor subunit n=1 Tax=Paenibacillus sp. GSMTC-2017 TaxID=2794350 RepID=UPI0018D939FA|nr:efflux RND transporter periplasmic adaptor subunit [Paenibacillus sp. GSMTC-2017]MBH5320212.1 efflux RND transporter periplasmic adaptor subunit [Paenibacillus sp. GSMTC-2017]
MKKKIKWIVICIVLAGISFFLYNMANPNRLPAPVVNEGAITFDVTKETIVSSVEVKGKSNYELEQLVYAPYGAKVEKWYVKNGQKIEKGQTLFELDRTLLQDQIAQEEATIKKVALEEKLSKLASATGSAEVTIEMTEDERKRAFAKREADKVQAQLNSVMSEVQKKELDRKRKKIEEARFTAPMTGIFLFDVANKVPQIVDDQQYIGKVVDLNKLQMIVFVGENDVFRIKEGMSVAVQMNAMKEVPLKGKVMSVSKFAKATTDQTNADQAAQFEVVISLEASEHLIAGLSLKGDIEISRKEDVVVVPTIAILREQDKHYVMLDKGNGVYERKDIEIGQETPDKTEVVKGLQVGDKVVLQ